MKKTLYFYVCREIGVPFLLGMATFTSVLLMGRIIKLADLVVAKGVPFADVVRLVIYLLPYFSIVTIPMAFLLALLLAFGRLSADCEIIAMKGCGIGLYGLLPPVLTCAVLAYLATTFVSVYAVPWGNSAFKKLVHDTIESRVDMTIKEQVFNGDIPGIVLYVDRNPGGRGVMRGILIQDERDPASPTTIFAERGTVVADPAARSVRLQLTNGSIHRILNNTGYRHVTFEEYELAISLGQENKKVAKDELDMTLAELRGNLYAPGTSAKLRLDMQLEFHRRFALPFACFVFALIGVPLGIQNQRSGKAAGFTVSIGVLLAYYIVLTAGKALGERGLLLPAAAVWAPNYLFFILGVYLFRATAGERRLFIFDLASNLVRSLRALSRRDTMTR